jgi:hypothetical protein
MAAGGSALNFALILPGILLRLTPERAPRTVLRDERASFKFGHHKSNVKSVESRVREIAYGFGDPSEKNLSPH